MVIILKNNIPSAFKWVCLYKKLMCINHTSFPLMEELCKTFLYRILMCEIIVHSEILRELKNKRHFVFPLLFGFMFFMFTPKGIQPHSGSSVF